MGTSSPARFGSTKEADDFLHEHVGYEFDMALHCHIGLSSMNRPVRGTGPEWNVLLEGFYLHSRVLAGFLRIPRNGRTDTNLREGDIDARSFLKAEWPPRAEPRFPWDVMDKLVAHIGLARVRKDDIARYAVYRAAEPISRLMVEFNAQRVLQGSTPLRPYLVREMLRMVDPDLG